jgi:pimeloyl-ACP methyl ester carboxylesterase
VKTEPYAYTDQVNDLNDLLKVVGLKPPFNIVGLSYGGGIGAGFAFKFPTKINNLIMMAPYTQALSQQDEWIKGQIAIVRLLFPYNQYSYDQLYDYYLKQICYTTYPSVEPIVLENPYKLEAVFRMTQGIRKFRVSDEINKFPNNSVFLVIAKKDQYIPQQVLEDFWTSIPAKARVQKIYVENSEHKIPEAQPAVAARIIEKIVTRVK